MPDDAGPGSSIQVDFDGSDSDLNKYTEAYVASYYKQEGDQAQIGDKLILYDGEWVRDIPADATALEKSNPSVFYQKKKKSPTTFLESEELISLDGDSNNAAQTHKIKVEKQEDKTQRSMFVTIMSAREKAKEG